MTRDKGQKRAREADVDDEVCTSSAKKHKDCKINPY